MVAGGMTGQPSAGDGSIVLKGHTDSVEAVAVSPDGTRVASACADREVRLFELATGALVRAYAGEAGHKGQVLAVAFNSRGDQLATGGADNTARVWDVPVNVPVTSYPAGAAATRVFVSAADGKTFAVARSDGVVRIFPQGEEKGAIELKGHTGVVRFLTQSGPNWVTGGADKTIRLWDVAGQPIGQYSLPTAELTGLVAAGTLLTTHSDGVWRTWQLPPQPTRSFPTLKAAVTTWTTNADGSLLAIATADKTVKLATPANLTLTGTLTGAKGSIEALALSPDSATVAAGCHDGSVILWDRQGQVKAELQAHPGGVAAVVFHPTQPLLLTAGADGSVRGWVLPLDPKQPKDKAVKAEFKAHTGKVTAAVANPANGQLVTAGADKLLRVWDVTRPEKPVKEFSPLAAPVTVLTISRDGTLLAGAAGKSVTLWTTAEGKEVGQFPQPAEVTSLALTADKARLLVGRADSVAVLIDAKDGTVIQSFAQAGPVKGVFALPAAVITASADQSVTLAPVTVTRAVPVGRAAGLVLAPDGQRVVTVGPGTECVAWLTANGTRERAFATDGDATAAAFSRDGQRVLVTGAGGTARLYAVADGKLLGSFPTGGSVSELAFHPTLARLVGLVKNEAVVWNVELPPGQPVPPEFGRRLQTYPHPGAVSSAAFAADGYFYTAGEDQFVRRFRIASDTPVRTFQHPNLVAAVAFDDTGNLLATGCHDGSLRVWDVPKNTLLKTITAHVTTTPQQAQNPIYAVLWSPDHKQVFTGSFDRSIRLWDVASGNLVREFKAAPDPVPILPVKAEDKDKKEPTRPDAKTAAGAAGPAGHRDQVFSLALSKDGKLLASASSDRFVKLWDVTTGRVIRDFENPDLKPVFPGEPTPSHPGWVQSVQFTPDGKYLVSAGPAPRGKGYLAVWRVADGKREFATERDHGPIQSMTLAPDGSRLVIGMALARGRPEATVLVLPFPR